MTQQLCCASPSPRERSERRGGLGGGLFVVVDLPDNSNRELIAPTPDLGSPHPERRGVPRSPRAARGGGEDLPLALSIRSLS